jgi:glucokinase
MEKVVLTIDIGGSKYMVGLADVKGRIFAVRSFLWTSLEAEDIIKDIVRSSRAILQDSPDYPPHMIGVTIPGLADPKRGIWVESSFSGVKNLKIGEKLQKEFGIPAFIDNDAKACALAEKLYGIGREVSDFIYLTVSNGCGGAIFANNKLYYGADGNAGELGHCVVVENGRPCNCGNRGCLEVYAAGPAIVANYLELAGNVCEHKERLSAKQIAELAKAGDPVAKETYRLEGYYLGKVLAAACNLLNPSMIILGGGISLSFSLFEKSLKETLHQFLYENANLQLQIRPTPLGYHGALLGAAAVAVFASDVIEC